MTDGFYERAALGEDETVEDVPAVGLAADGLEEVTALGEEALLVLSEEAVGVARLGQLVAAEEELTGET